MPYINDKGEKKFSLREKIAYHNKCANTGMQGGKQLTFSQRVNHIIASRDCRIQLGNFLNEKDSKSKKNLNYLFDSLEDFEV